VIDNDELLSAEQVMGDDQRAEGVFGGDASGVADDVGVAGFEAEELFDGEAGVHAGEHGDVLRRRQGERAAEVGRQHAPERGLGGLAGVDRQPLAFAGQKA